MDDRLPYNNSSPDLRETSSLLSDPLFHLESQRQVSLRHLRRMKRLQAEKSDSELIPAEENEKDVHLAKLRLNADLRVLATMIDDLRSASAERRKDWRWSLPVLACPIITLGHLIPLPRLQKNGAIVLALALLAAQTARRESAPRIYKLLHEQVMWLNVTVTIQESTTERITNQDIATETITPPLTSSESKDEDILGQSWWKLLPYV